MDNQKKEKALYEHYMEKCRTNFETLKIQEAIRGTEGEFNKTLQDVEPLLKEVRTLENTIADYEKFIENVESAETFRKKYNIGSKLIHDSIADLENLRKELNLMKLDLQKKQAEIIAKKINIETHIENMKNLVDDSFFN